MFRRLLSPRRAQVAVRGLLLLLVLSLALAAPLLINRPLGTAQAAAPVAQQPEVTGGELALQPASFRAVTGAASMFEGALSVGAGKQTSYESDQVEAPLDFSDVSVSWSGTYPDGSDVFVELRTSADGKNWTAWEPSDLEDIVSPEDPADTNYTDLVPVPQTDRTHRYAQARLTLSSDATGEVPTISSMKLNFINSGATVGTPMPEITDMVAAPAKPNVVPRTAWGAPTGNASPKWPLEFRLANHFIIHHTATPNDDSDPAARVRAIWYYHAITRGWGDIGYNYLIDAKGTIYEGRAGGDDSAAGHAYPFNYGSVGIALIGDFDKADPTPSAYDALIRLLTWKAAQRSIDPQGSGTFTGALDCGGSVSLTEYNIAGHRDFHGTGCGKGFNTSSCPGDHLYAMLPKIRKDVAAALPPYRALFISTTTPQSMQPGAVYTATVTVRNGGSLLWGKTGPNPVHLAFRWYTLDGALLQSGYRDFHTDLPKELAYGESATVLAQVGAPDKPGVYNLAWDMVHEGVAWFGDRGSDLLTLRVNVGDGDQSSPTAHVLVLNPYQRNNNFTVQWGGGDDIGGSGLATYNVQYRAGSGEWTDWLKGTQATTAVFNGQEGVTYSFRVSAVDLAGNAASYPAVADAVTTVDSTPPQLAISSPAPGQQVSSGSLQVVGNSDGDALVSVNGEPALQAGGVFTATVSPRSTNFAISVVAADPAGNETSRTITVHTRGRFGDVPPESPAFEAVEYLAQRGIISGYGDGTFQPGGNATRAQYTKMLAAAFKWPQAAPQTQRFGDVALDNWAAPFIEQAAAQGLITGYADGTFHPLESVTRAQAVKILVLAAQKIAPTDWRLLQGPSSPFEDVPLGHWAYPYLETAYRHGAITLPDSGQFFPDRPATRADLSLMLYYTLGDLSEAGKMP